MLTASTPFSNRYSWISSTSAFFSENTNTYIIGSGGDGNTGVARLQIFNEYSQLHKMTYRGWGLLQTLQEVDDLCLLFHVFYLLDDIQTGGPCSAHIHRYYGNRQTTRLYCN